MKRTLLNMTMALSLCTAPTLAQDILSPAGNVESRQTAGWTPVQQIDFSPAHHKLIRNADGALLPMDREYFEVKQVAPYTWQIASDGDYAYLLEGEQEAVMIDTGYGAGNLREFAQNLTTKPLRNVINTHSHFDHTAGNAYFHNTYMTTYTKLGATVPYASFAGIQVPRDYPVVEIKENFVYHLGGRDLEVFEIGNHDEGGIVLLDRQNRLLFSGDEILPFVMIKTSVELFKERMLKMKNLENDYDVIWGGIGQIDKKYLDNAVMVADAILAGELNENTVEPANQQRKASATSDNSEQIIYNRKSVRAGDGGAHIIEPGVVTVKYQGVQVKYNPSLIHKTEQEKSADYPFNLR